MSEYIPGLNCKCQARSEYECACDDVDWTPREVYQLRAERDRYKSALEEIGKYDKNSKYGDGICPYGCDCPDIARQALETP